MAGGIGRITHAIARTHVHQAVNMNTPMNTPSPPFSPLPLPPLSPAQFFKVFQSLQRFVVVDLSNFYLDTAKDRLYIRGPDDPARRACQTVLDALLRGLLAALAPLVPHMAEDAWLNLPYARPAGSVFQAGWARPDPAWAAGLSEQQAAGWAVLLEVRDAANAVLEKARSGKAIGAGLEARVVVHVSEPVAAAALAALDAAGNGADELRYLLIVSQVGLRVGGRWEEAGGREVGGKEGIALVEVCRLGNRVVTSRSGFTLALASAHAATSPPACSGIPPPAV